MTMRSYISERSLGQTCTTSSQCSANNAECPSGTCQCQSGYNDTLEGIGGTCESTIINTLAFPALNMLLGKLLRFDFNK